MCGDNRKAAITLYKQRAASGQSCLWNTRHISCVNTHASTHLPTNSSASRTHQPQRKHGPPAGAPNEEVLTRRLQTARDGIKESSRLSFAGTTVVPGGVSGERDRLPKLKAPHGVREVNCDGGLTPPSEACWEVYGVRPRTVKKGCVHDLSRGSHKNTHDRDTKVHRPSGAMIGWSTGEVNDAD